MKPSSLEKNILTKVGIIFIFSTVIIALLSGILMFRYHVKIVEKQIISENYLTAEKETVRFQNAVNQLSFLRNQIIAGMKAGEVKKNFSSYMEHKDDGSYRTFKIKSNSGTNAIGFISEKTQLTPDFEHQYMITYDLIQTVGSINKENYFMTWAVFPNDSHILFCPEKPNANDQIKDDFSNTKENYWKLSTNALNPNKSGKWLSPYYDPSVHVWMISYIVPVYDNNIHIMSIGFDIKLDDFFNKILNSESQDDQQMFYFVMSKDGALIAHPKYMNQIKNAKAGFSIFDLPVNEKEPYSQLLLKDDYIETSDYKYTKSKIGNTNWILVSAYNNLNYIYVIKHMLVILGFVFFFLILLLIGSKIFLRKKMTDPLIQLAKSMSDNKTTGDYTELPTGSVSEINDVIEAYNQLLQAYKEKNDYIEIYSSRLRDELETELKKGLELAKSVMMTDVTRTINADVFNPLTILKMNIDIIKNKIKNNNFKDIERNVQTSLNIIKKISKIIFKLEVIEKSLKIEDTGRVNIGSIFLNLKKIYDEQDDLKANIEWVYEDYKHIATKEFSTIYSLMLLIDNSIESVGKKEDSWIKVEAKEVGDNFIFTITDSGKPVEKNIIKNIFAVDNVGGFSSKEGHRGYGLHTCMKIMTEAKGTLTYFENKENPCFELKYPIKKDELQKMVISKRVS